MMKSNYFFSSVYDFNIISVLRIKESNKFDYVLGPAIVKLKGFVKRLNSAHNSQFIAIIQILFF